MFTAKDISWLWMRYRMKDNNRLDRIYRNVMLLTGSLTAVLFILSLISMIEFPGAFKYLLIGMIGTSVFFFALRTIYRFRETFKIKTKK